MHHQANLRYSFEPLSSDAEFDVVTFKLTEALSAPFTLELELASDADDVDFGKLLDKPALFTLWDGDHAVRRVHGLISTLTQGDSGFRRTRYSALVEPQLARARLRSNWRIFQHKTVPQILELMLKRQGILYFDVHASREHQVREFCVQAGETDFDFMARLAAEEGFLFNFEHTTDRHKLIFTDQVLTLGMVSYAPIAASNGACPSSEDQDAPSMRRVLYHANDTGGQHLPCLRRFHYSEHVRTEQQVQRDYSFRYPAFHLEEFAYAYDLKHPSNDYERFDYPGRYKRGAVGKPFTETRMAALRHDARMAEVEGDDPRLQAGLAFVLVGHPRDDLNAPWRVASVTHTGIQYTSLEEESAEAEQGTRYDLQARLVPGMAQWRPAALPKPRIDGPQMATVVGPPGEEIYCDEWGRVKVSFPWDRESASNEFSSCWVRVSQFWAGGSWGSMAIPRVGQEVLIQYIDSDPDQPMICGRTYCADQLPPYDLPDHKTRMTIKSQTHKGDGFNELRFEDELGREEVFIHAQRDMNTKVGHDEQLIIGNDRATKTGRDAHASTARDERIDIGRDRHDHVHQDSVTHIDRNESRHIGDASTQTIGRDQHVSIGGNQTLIVEGTRTLEARTAQALLTRSYMLQGTERIHIRGPNGKIVFDAEGITLEAAAIRFIGDVTYQSGAQNQIEAIEAAVRDGSPLVEECPFSGKARK